MQTLLISCTNQGNVQPINLQKYSTPTSIASSTPLPPLFNTPAPTPTIHSYTISKNDTIYGIAKSFDLTPEVLLSANPAVNPNSLTIGDTLVIPVDGQQTNIPTNSTPVPLLLTDPTCIPQPDGTACFVTVQNNSPSPIDGVSVRFNLFDHEGKQIGSKIGLLLLNTLEPGQSLPASVFFTGLAQPSSILTEQVSSYPFTNFKKFDNASTLTDQQVSVSWDGKIAYTHALLENANGFTKERTIWVGIVSYNADGKINGYRRWEWTGVLASGSTVEVKSAVFGLGSPIQTVQYFIEEISQNDRP